MAIFLQGRVALSLMSCKYTTLSAPRLKRLLLVPCQNMADGDGYSHSVNRPWFFGTFWLVLGGCRSAVPAAAVPDVGIGLPGVSLAFGLAVLTMACAIAHSLLTALVTKL